MRMTYPLRIIIPLLLLLITLLSSTYNYFTGIKHEQEQIKHEIQQDIKRYSQLLINQFESEHRQPDLYLVMATLEALNILLPQMMDFLLIDGQDRIHASLNHRHRGISTTELFYSRSMADWTRMPSGLPQVTEVDNLQIISMVVPIIFPENISPASQGRLAIRIDLTSELNNVKQVVLHNIINSSAMLVVLALMLWLISYFLVSRRVLRLVKATQAFARGDLDTRARLRGRDELGTISKAFDRMAKRLSLTMQRLQNREAQLRLLLDTTAEGIFAIDLDGVCLLANPACAELLGYTSPSELIGQNMHDIAHHTYADGRPYPRQECPIGQALANGGRVHRDSEVFWRKDNSSFNVEYWSYPMKNGGNNIGAVITFFDITVRKQDEAEIQRHRHHLEELIEERTSELRTVNKELEAFSYSVSHDLKAPLRSIIGFSRALTEEYSHIFDETSTDYLQRISKAAARMADIIEDLLTLSSVNSKELQLTTINLSEMANRIFATRCEEFPEKYYEIDIAENLEVCADNSLLYIALENLLGNAVKFSSHEEKPRIEFKKDVINGNEIYYIKDNGAGFDMTFADKLFKPFQRLHKLDEFDGTGIGLATVQRVINRHGGTIWGESQPDRGATFYFTLGDAPPNIKVNI